MSWKTVKLKQVLRQYRVTHIVQDDQEYKQVTISKHDGVKFRGTKTGKDIGRKRQFIIDLENHPNTLMMVRQGVYDGAIGIAPEEVNGCIATENMPMFDIQKINVDFLNLIIQSPYFREELEKIPTTGSAQKSIHERQILEIEIPYPNSEVQERLVHSFEENKLNIGQISTEFTHQLSLVKQLRQAFLREAMQGKLVPQDPNDEPAAVLLEKIKSEKEQLIKEKKIKKEKSLPPISKEEIPFEIPENWVWCRLGEIIQISSGDGLTSAQMEKSGNIPVYGGNGVNGFHNNFNVNKETIVIGRVGYYCGCVHLTESKSWVTDNAFLVKYSEKNIHRGYLIQVLKWADLGKQQFSGSQPVISGQRVYPKLIPIPPFTEQRRIVTKLDELMKMCDNLEASIKESQHQNEALLQQVLREALEVKEFSLLI